MDLISGLTLAAPAGLNAYIPLLTVALCQRFGVVELAQPWDALGSWWVIGLVAALLVVEVVADKVPAVDHANDAVQTVVRPAAGGLLALSSSGQLETGSIVLCVAGVLIAGGVHTVKATARPVVNVTTGGAGAPVVSTIEDAAAVVMSVLAIVLPILAALAVIALVVVVVIAARRLRRRRAPEATPPPPA